MGAQAGGLVFQFQALLWGGFLFWVNSILKQAKEVSFTNTPHASLFHHAASHRHQALSHPAHQFVAATRDADIVSGSRYLKRLTNDAAPPAERRRINVQVTAELNRHLSLALTDAFCGFKAYRVSAPGRPHLPETGDAWP